MESSSYVSHASRKNKSSLHHAIQSKKYWTAQQLIEAGADVNAIDEHSKTPLHYAATSERIWATRQLIEAGADVNAIDEYKKAPLHYAATSKTDQTTQQLIEAGADVNAIDDYKKTPLHYAATSETGQTARKLIETWADVNAIDEYKKTPLHYAATSNISLNTQQLIGAGSDVDAVDEHSMTPLHYAAASETDQTTQLLIEVGADVNAIDEYKKTPLHYAATSETGRTTRRLVEAGADVNAIDEYKKTPLHYAATLKIGLNTQEPKEAEGDVNAIEEYEKISLHHAATPEISLGNPELIVAGPSLNPKMTPLHYAATLKLSLGTQKLIEAGADVNAIDEHSMTPLHYAATSERGQTTQLLIDAGANVNATDEYKKTPLHYAATSHTSQTAQQLIEARADVNAIDEHRMTPLHYAVMWETGQTTQQLIEAEADVNAIDAYKETPPHYADTAEISLNTQLLIEAGADVNAIDEHSMTPLHYAASSGMDETSRRLIEAGADVNAVDERNMAPLHYAAEYGGNTIVRLLIVDGANVNAIVEGDMTPLYYAARNERYGEEVTALLLEHIGDEVKVTEAVVEAAVMNMHAGGRIVGLLAKPVTQDGPWITSKNFGIPPPAGEVKALLHQSFCAHKFRQRDAGEWNHKSIPNPLTEHLSREIMQKQVSLFCGLAGVFPPGTGPAIRCAQVKFSTETASVFFNDKSETLQLSSEPSKEFLSQLYEASRGVSSAAALLQQNGFCCNQFTVLTATKQNPILDGLSVVHMNTVPFSLLIDLSQEFQKLHHNGFKDSTFSRSVSISTDIMSQLSGITLPPLSTIECKMHFCSLTVQLLCLGMVFYAQGHTGELYPAYLAEPVKKVFIQGISTELPNIVFEPCELTCMRELVGGKVFAFRMSPQLLQSDIEHLSLSSNTNAFYLSATCEEIVDSWGPGSLILDPVTNSLEKIFGVIIRGGVVKRDRMIQNGSYLFHWGENLGEEDLSPLKAFGYRDRIVVGTTAINPIIHAITEGNYTSHRSRNKANAGKNEFNTSIDIAAHDAEAERNEDQPAQRQIQAALKEKLQVQQAARKPCQEITHPDPYLKQAPDRFGPSTININCPRNCADSFIASQAFFSEIGTSAPCWKFVERSAIFQAGAYIIGQVGGVQARQSGQSLKRRFLDRWTDFEKLSQFEEHLGFQISPCTGVARRVPLRVLIRDDLMGFIDSLKITGWQDLREEAQAAMASKQEFAKWSKGLDEKRKECMTKVFGKLLICLKDTGFDPNGQMFSILWPYDSGATQCVKIYPQADQAWISMLKDKEWSATFAVATNLCLEAPQHKCRKIPAASWHGAKLLSTFVFQSLSGVDPANVATHTGPTWCIKDNQRYWGGEIGGKVQFLARKPANAVTELKFQQKRLHHVPKALRSLLQPRDVLWERHNADLRAEEVFILTEA